MGEYDNRKFFETGVLGAQSIASAVLKQREWYADHRKWQERPLSMQRVQIMTQGGATEYDRRTMKKALRHTGVFGFFFALSVFNTYPLILSLGSKTLNYTSFPWQHDWWFNSWLLFHGIDILQNLTSGIFFFDTAFYPLGTPVHLYGHALALCAAQPFLKLFSLPAATNSLILLSLSAAGYTAFLLGRNLLKSTPFGLIAGAIFCSSPIMLAQAKSHLVVLMAIFAIPLYILFLVKTTENPTSKNAISLSVSAIFLALSYLYFLNMLFLFTILFLLVKAAEKKIGWAQTKCYLVALLLFLPFVAPNILLLLRGSGLSLGVSLSQVRVESVDLLALFLPDVDHPVFGPLVQEIRGHFLNNPILHSAYIGLSILILSALALKFDFKNMRLWIISAVFFTLMSLGPVIHWIGNALSLGVSLESGYMPYVPYYLLFKPFVVSDCSMFFILAMVFWSLLAGFGIKKAWLMAGKQKGRVLLLCSILCLIWIDFLGISRPMLDIPDARPFQIIKEDPHDVSVLHLPYANDRIIYSYFQCLHGRKILNPAHPRRLNHSFLTYGDNLPGFVRLKHLEGLSSHEITRSEMEEAAAFQRFFNLGYIILHKNLLKEPGALPSCSDFITKAYDAVPVFEDETLVVWKLRTLPKGDPPATLPERIVFDGREKNVVFSGWSYPEKDGAGKTWRWSDAKRSDLIINTGMIEEMVMRCKVHPFIYTPDATQSVSVMLNEALLEKITLSESIETYDVRIPAARLRKGHNRFTFVYGYAYSPLEKGVSTDPRTLAVAFHAIEFIPLSKSRNQGVDTQDETTGDIGERTMGLRDAQ